jgi:acetate---CoA ligase (ADP-forming)
LKTAALEALLARYAIPTPKQAIASDAAEAERHAIRVGYPVALKAIAANLHHKSDVGGVRLNLKDAEDLAEAIRDFKEYIPSLEAFLVQAMVPNGLEVLVGARRDPLLGPFITFGFGGTTAELFKDAAHTQPAPLTRQQAHALITKTRLGPLLTGYRGSGGYHVRALTDVIANLSKLISREENILEIEVNPLVVTATDALAVDVRAQVAPKASNGRYLQAPELRFADRVPRDLSGLLEPKSIAVVGASRNPAKLGSRLLTNIQSHGYPGKLYAIHPDAKDLADIPCFPTIAHLPEIPQLVCIAVAAERVCALVQSCAEAGVPNVIVYSSGFSEAGAEGAALEERLRESIANTATNLCGPNTAGVVSTRLPSCTSMALGFNAERILAGSVALVAQSGAIGSSLVSRASSTGVGISTWIATGNEADLTLSDYLRFLASDARTRVIALFVETIRDPSLFARACRTARRNGKTIVAYKTGNSGAGKRAVFTHTAAIAGDQVLYESFLDELGVIQVNDLQSLIDIPFTLASQPPLEGRRVGIISASGGACSVTADECTRMGFDVPKFSDIVTHKIRSVIPTFGVAENPVDVTMEVNVRPEMVAAVARLLAVSDEVDAVVVAMTTNADPGAAAIASGLTEVFALRRKPLIVIRMGAESLAPRALQIYREAGLMVFPMPRQAAIALSGLKKGSPLGRRGR